MARVERPWLRRIGGWTGNDPRPRRRLRPGEGGAPAGPAPEQDDPDALADDPQGQQAVPDDAAGDTAPQDTSAQGDPSRGDPTEQEADPGEQEGDPADGPPDDLGLEIPDEVEQRRRDEERKRSRSALNRGLAPQAFGLEGHYLRNLATRFARMISKVAEDSADLPSEGDEEWDLNELIRRRFTGRLLSQCRMTRDKRKVAVVLDTSPSCESQARLFGSIARIAEELGDCELFDAPNFVIHARKVADAWEQLPEAEGQWRFRGRAVLAFGDFDGIDRICEASRVRGNRLYWFCCEERPSVLEAGRELFVKQYKGHYFPTTHLDQLMQALRRVR